MLGSFHACERSRKTFKLSRLRQALLRMARKNKVCPVPESPPLAHRWPSASPCRPLFEKTTKEKPFSIDVDSSP
ncbi:Hypothetical predicted protein [Podarcis lilfordi]|uniref:Uncharacterized protein n=1 Tax=Podarcis lilfordi TaxID=74358 RepID=A0AA35K1T7_9SAUR|nr:Hypothetical predicted protein [Podarcis lilfordi]